MHVSLPGLLDSGGSSPVSSCWSLAPRIILLPYGLLLVPGKHTVGKDRPRELLPLPSVFSGVLGMALSDSIEENALTGNEMKESYLH